MGFWRSRVSLGVCDFDAYSPYRIHKDRISGHSIRLPGLAGGMPTLPSMSIMGLGGSSSASAQRDGKDRAGKKDEGTAEEQWTRACRAVLYALKRILVVESEADRMEMVNSAPAISSGSTQGP